MNPFEARLLLMCKDRALTTSQIMVRLAEARRELESDVPVAYKYINSRLAGLNLLGYVRRTRAGKVSYFTSTPEGVGEAMVFLKKAGSEEARNRAKASRKMTNIISIGSFCSGGSDPA